MNWNWRKFFVLGAAALAAMVIELCLLFMVLVYWGSRPEEPAWMRTKEASQRLVWICIMALTGITGIVLLIVGKMLNRGSVRKADASHPSEGPERHQGG